MWGILFATKELGDPLNDSSQRAPCSLLLLDAVARLLSFNGIIGDRFVALFSAHAYLHSLARRVLYRRLTLWRIRRHQSLWWLRRRDPFRRFRRCQPLRCHFRRAPFWWLDIRHVHSLGRFHGAYPPGRYIKTVRLRRRRSRASRKLGAHSADRHFGRYFEFNRSMDEWTRGDFAGCMGPGVWTGSGFGPAVREPVGRVHWADVVRNISRGESDLLGRRPAQRTLVVQDDGVTDQPAISVAASRRHLAAVRIFCRESTDQQIAPGKFVSIQDGRYWNRGNLRPSSSLHLSGTGDI
jgi:hypothetical protein